PEPRRRQGSQRREEERRRRRRSGGRRGGRGMRNALLIARREIGSYLGSPIGYVVAAVALLIQGLWFTFLGLTKGALLSAQVLGGFFEGASETTIILAALLSMRLLAGERENGTMVLLNTAPVRESEIVLGKFLAGLGFLAA